MFFEKKGPVWETLRALEQRLDNAGIDYVVIGGLALTVHNYPRQTVDVDVILTADGFGQFKKRFAPSVYMAGSGAPRRFLDTDSDVAVDILLAGELAGDTRKNTEVRFPEPTEAERHGEMRTVSLVRLIELKLVTWRFKDWGDVVELIRHNSLDEAFAEQLHPLVQTAYIQCYDQANDPIYGPR